MKRTFRLLAIVIAVTAILGWVVMGANRGWTRTSVPVTAIDEVTGIEAIQYRKRFVPGVELLAGALAGAGFLAAVSFFVRSPNTKQINK